MNLFMELYVKKNPIRRSDISENEYNAKAYNATETEEYDVYWEIKDGKGWDTPTHIIDKKGNNVLEQRNDGLKKKYVVRFMFFTPKEVLKDGQTREKLFFEFPEYDEYSFTAQGADESGNRYSLLWKSHFEAPEEIRHEDGTDCTNEDWELVYDEKLYEYKKFDRDFRFVITKSVNGLVTVIGTEKFLSVAMKVMRKDFDKAPKENTHSLTAHFGKNILCVNEKTGDKTEWNVIDLSPYFCQQND